MFGSNSIWRQDVSSAPLDDDSAAMVTNLADQVHRYYGSAAFNVYAYNATWYNATDSTPVATVGFTNCQNRPLTPPGLYGSGGQFVDVPIPANATPSTGTDATLTIYRADTDQLWELWKASHDSSGWHACWGGRIDHVSTSPGYFTNGHGASATGLASEAGDISISDVNSGSIDHAITLAIPSPARGEFTWPAQRTDGNSIDPDAIPEGSRLRLDPTVDVDALHLSPIGTMIAKAAQKYGFILTNKSGAVAVVTESGSPAERATGTNPWTALLGASKPDQVLKDFPWTNMQVLQPAYGKASTLR